MIIHFVYAFSESVPCRCPCLSSPMKWNRMIRTSTSVPMPVQYLYNSYSMLILYQCLMRRKAKLPISTAGKTNTPSTFTVSMKVQLIQN